MSMEEFSDFYRNAGFLVHVEANELKLELNGHKFRVDIDAEWRISIDEFYKAKQYTLRKKRMLSAYKSVEVPLIKLSSSFSSRPEHEFSDKKGSVVKVTHLAVAQR